MYYERGIMLNGANKFDKMMEKRAMPMPMMEEMEMDMAAPMMEDAVYDMAEDDEPLLGAALEAP
jgi:hypothetical protein